MNDGVSGRGAVVKMESLSEARFGFVSSWVIDMGMMG